jgi:hypothetical protein
MALMLSLMFAIDVTERRVAFDRSNIKLEIEEVGAAVALRTMEVVRDRPYDANLIPVLGSFIEGDEVANKAALTFWLNVLMAKQMPTSPGRGCHVFDPSFPPCPDINAFNKIDPFTVGHPIGTDTLWYEVGIEVRYVDADGNPQSNPGLTKEAIVYVQDLWPESGRKGVYLRSPIRLSRIVSLQL